MPDWRASFFFLFSFQERERERGRTSVKKGKERTKDEEFLLAILLLATHKRRDVEIVSDGRCDLITFFILFRFCRSKQQTRGKTNGFRVEGHRGHEKEADDERKILGISGSKETKDGLGDGRKGLVIEIQVGETVKGDGDKLRIRLHRLSKTVGDRLHFVSFHFFQDQKNEEDLWNNKRKTRTNKSATIVDDLRKDADDLLFEGISNKLEGFEQFSGDGLTVVQMIQPAHLEQDLLGQRKTDDDDDDDEQKKETHQKNNNCQ